jgi:magnesium chelatase subunit I
MQADKYVQYAKEITGLQTAVRKLTKSEYAEVIASACEFILEGLHVNKKLNKTKSGGKTVYRC